MIKYLIRHGGERNIFPGYAPGSSAVVIVVIVIQLLVTKFHPLFDYDYDNDNRSATASLTTRKTHTHFKRFQPPLSVVELY
jgi:hypothetical protein